MDLLVICLAWVHINHHAKNNLPRMWPSGETSPDEILIRGTDTNGSEASKGGGPGACPRKNFCDHTLQIVGKCPFL